MKNNNYILYYNWGFDFSTNLIYSYIFGWGKQGTYVSNDFLSEITGLSISTIKRSIKELVDGGYVRKANTRNKRKRYLKTTSMKTPNDVEKERLKSFILEAQIELIKGSK